MIITGFNKVLNNRKSNERLVRYIEQDSKGNEKIEVIDSIQPFALDMMRSIAANRKYNCYHIWCNPGNDYDGDLQGASQRHFLDDYLRNLQLVTGINPLDISITKHLKKSNKRYVPHYHMVAPFFVGKDDHSWESNNYLKMQIVDVLTDLDNDKEPTNHKRYGAVIKRRIKQLIIDGKKPKALLSKLDRIPTPKKEKTTQKVPSQGKQYQEIVGDRRENKRLAAYYKAIDKGYQVIPVRVPGRKTNTLALVGSKNGKQGHVVLRRLTGVACTELQFNKIIISEFGVDEFKRLQRMDAPYAKELRGKGDLRERYRQWQQHHANSPSPRPSKGPSFDM